MLRDDESNSRSPDRAHECRVPKLIWDTAAATPGEGVRSTATGTRHLLYQLESLYIDLQLKPTSDSMLIVGQLADGLEPGRELDGVPVVFELENGGALSSTLCNDLGEFILTCPLSTPALRMRISRREFIEIPLREVLTHAKGLA